MLLLPGISLGQEDSGQFLSTQVFLKTDNRRRQWKATKNSVTQKRFTSVCTKMSRGQEKSFIFNLILVTF